MAHPVLLCRVKEDSGAVMQARQTEEHENDNGRCDAAWAKRKRDATVAMTGETTLLSSDGSVPRATFTKNEMASRHRQHRGRRVLPPLGIVPRGPDDGDGCPHGRGRHGPRSQDGKQGGVLGEGDGNGQGTGDDNDDDEDEEGDGDANANAGKEGPTERAPKRRRRGSQDGAANRDLGHPRHLTHYVRTEVHQLLFRNRCYMARAAPGARSEQRRVPTGLLYDGYRGGRVSVDDALYPHFLEAYAKDVTCGMKHCISEQRSPVFRMHFDLDLVGDDRCLTTDRVVELCRVVQGDMARFWGCPMVPIRRADGAAADLSAAAAPSAHYLACDIYLSRPKRRRPQTAAAAAAATVAASQAGDRETSRAGGDAEAASAGRENGGPEGGMRFAAAVGSDGMVWKQGIHVVFPELPVDGEMALHMRESVLCELAAVYGFRPTGCNPWSDVVDARIYTHNGLRMVYSHKLERCAHCQGRGAGHLERCAACANEGYVGDGRFYQPAASLEAGGRRCELREALLAGNVTMAVRCASIRLPAGTPVARGWRPYAGAPVPDLGRAGRRSAGGGTAGDRRRRCRRRTDASVDGESSASYGEGGGGVSRSGTTAAMGRVARPLARGIGKVSVPRECPRFAELVAFVRTCLHRSYCQVEGHALTTNDECSAYRLQVEGRGAHFCLNIGKDHASSKIYFEITPDGIAQRCYCRCDTTEGRFTGVPCSQYASVPTGLSVRLLRLLFSSVRGTPLSKARRTRARAQLTKAMDVAVSREVSAAEPDAVAMAASPHRGPDSPGATDSGTRALARSAATTAAILRTAGLAVSPRLTRDHSHQHLEDSRDADSASFSVGRSVAATALRAKDPCVADFFLRLVNIRPDGIVRTTSAAGMDRWLPMARLIAQRIRSLPDLPRTAVP